MDWPFTSTVAFEDKMNLNFGKWLFPNAEWERNRKRTVFTLAIGGSILLVFLVAYLMLKLSDRGAILRGFQLGRVKYAEPEPNYRASFQNSRVATG